MRTGETTTTASMPNGVQDGAEYDVHRMALALSGPPNGAVLLNDVSVIPAHTGEAR